MSLLLVARAALPWVCTLRGATARGLTSSSSSASSGSPISTDSEEAKAARDRPGGDTYYATPTNSSSSSDGGGNDAQEAALAASRAPQPTGPMDTSSVNIPGGRAEPDADSYQQHHQPRGGPPSAQEYHVHHPGREGEIAAMQARGDGGSSGGGAQGSRAQAGGAGADQGRPAGARASINPRTGLPQMAYMDGERHAAASGGDGGRFGALREPGAAKEEAVTAREARKSTGMSPAEAD